MTPETYNYFVDVKNREYHDDDGTIRVEEFADMNRGLPEFLAGLPAWAAGVVEKVPPEFREAATLELMSDEYNAALVVSYRRPETDEERDRRVEQTAAEDEKVERRERAELARLLEKYRGETELGVDIAAAVDELEANDA